ncbi:hypothetical protein AURDEDRAFT_115946 [Auricularia subglabra TFB-10046 SS5]|uniref:Nudix hydrolase domain-containing protein n=1 Tax=Auricularia subglabra (strain TFB-10046 / SS5) TaxID=717982 RepID=J0WWD9_AURST|nr:hypothetical protein AURDEDRAFT_115946 [Auricularia subglabra TFB-10046 SS5]
MNDAQLPIAIYTTYTTLHLDDVSYCVPDVTFQNGAVIINDNNEVLLYEDLESGRVSLPRCTLQDSFESFCETPLQFVSDATGLSVERLALLKPSRQYRNGDAEHWEDLDQELCFEGSALSTNFFSMALDIAWFENYQQPLYADGRQVFIRWYSGVVRGPADVVRAPDGYRARFLPLKKVISTVRQYDFVAENALVLFDVLWTETKRALSSRG